MRGPNLWTEQRAYGTCIPEILLSGAASAELCGHGRGRRFFTAHGIETAPTKAERRQFAGRSFRFLRDAYSARFPPSWTWTARIAARLLYFRSCAGRYLILRFCSVPTWFR